eukprot:909134-Pleurochrysis_carterae.AAC.2
MRCIRGLSPFQAFQRAFATASHMDGRGSLQGPKRACFESASSSSLSESLRSALSRSTVSPYRAASSNLSG